MKISFIHAGYFKLDGGAMFGVVPKTLWERLHAPDENNLCTWAMRCLLIESGDRKILIDTGIGNKQGAKWQSYFEPHGPENLRDSLTQNGLSPEDITDVLLTHLHFDHVGGAVEKTADGQFAPAFPNATYWSNERHWNWAINPNAREKASFLKENILPLQESGQLEFFATPQRGEDLEWLAGIRLRFVYGHTEAMVVPMFELAGQTHVYCADLLPSAFHIPMPYVMAFDIRPLHTLSEKERLLKAAVKNNWTLLFEHDPITAAAKLTTNEKGRIVLGETVSIGG